jgi:unsaturated chondroitin disaccharide hydrolase
MVAKISRLIRSKTISMVGSNLAILAPVSQNMLLGLSYFCFMYRILTAFLLISLLGTRAGAQRGERLQPKPALLRLIDANLRQAVNQYKVLMGRVPADRLPKTWYVNGDRLETSDPGWWTSGFYSGTLFNLYAFSQDTALLGEARRRLKLMEPEQYNKGTHDLGFMMYCSFGNGLRLIREGVLHQDAAVYDSILLTSARSLSTRFDPAVGCIKSWDSKPWHFPVIIDNMMNLELLFLATQLSGDSSFYRIAVTHANTTMRNHYRPDYSSFHVVDYDSVTGAVIAKKTAQGYADSSAWARGQAWGLYGYTMVYRATHDPRYLAQAEHIAQFLLSNPNLPADKIPYWDFNAPGIPPATPAGGSSPARPAMAGPLRDASAAAIMASALIELSHYVQPAMGRQYLDVAEQIIVTLSSNVYKPVVGSNGGFILRHSVGHLPAHSEVDVPLTYADYYFVEAMLRYRQLAAR